MCYNNYIKDIMEVIMANNNNNKKNNSKLSMNKISFYVIGAISILYLVSAILSILNLDKLNFNIVGLFQAIATYVTVGVVSILAWRYVDSKPTVYKVLYFIFMVIVTITVFIPILKF